MSTIFECFGDGMKLERALFPAGVVVAMLAGVFVGLALADFSDFLLWLDRWQTLATGIFAVFAAAMTVAAMLRVDEAQAERHQRLLNISNRPDALIAQRGSARSIALIRVIGRCPAPEMKYRGVFETYDQGKLYNRETTEWLREAQTEFSHDTITECLRLFDGEMRMEYDELIADVTRAHKINVILRARLNKGSLQAAGEEAFELGRELGKVEMGLQFLADNLTKLEQIYQL